MFEGKDYPYVATNYAIEMAAMFGFIYNDRNVVKVSNRIFATVLYNYLLPEEMVNSRMYDSALANKYRFTEGCRLNMTRVLEGFVMAFGEISQGKDEKFPEEEGRKYFMIYLKPIINGTGHSYVEARTGNFVVALLADNRPGFCPESSSPEFLAEFFSGFLIKKRWHPAALCAIVIVVSKSLQLTDCFAFIFLFVCFSAGQFPQT